MELLDKKSIILQIGDLKLSDTYYTFSEKKYVNGILYLPLINPKGILCSPVATHLAWGDSREGVSISNDNDNTDEIFLTYGANRMGSNAQSMAIGYEDENGYFFIEECYQDSYAKNPRVSSRDIVRCQSTFEEGGRVKRIYSYYMPDLESKITKADNEAFQKLMHKVRVLKSAFSEENLNGLRKHAAK